MKVVIQRVKEAAVAVSGNEIARIGKGLMLLVGIGKTDTSVTAEALAKKISKLRIFEDENGKMNLNISDITGEILSVPQFTLLGNTDKGNRPGFDNAALPDEAKPMWEHFNDIFRSRNIDVKEGEFGAHMEVSLVNDGPVTFVLEITDNR